MSEEAEAVERAQQKQQVGTDGNMNLPSRRQAYHMNPDAKPDASAGMMAQQVMQMQATKKVV